MSRLLSGKYFPQRKLLVALFVNGYVTHITPHPPRRASANLCSTVAELKTHRNEGDVEAFLADIADERRRADARAICTLMTELAGEPPAMWGSSMVGFGSYSYTYASGRSGEWFAVGFAPRKQALTLYLMDGFGDYEALLARLGPHKTGKSCLHLKRLADVDQTALRELSRARWRTCARSGYARPARSSDEAGIGDRGDLHPGDRDALARDEPGDRAEHRHPVIAVGVDRAAAQASGRRPSPRSRRRSPRSSRRARAARRRRTAMRSDSFRRSSCAPRTTVSPSAKQPSSATSGSSSMASGTSSASTVVPTSGPAVTSRSLIGSLVATTADGSSSSPTTRSAHPLEDPQEAGPRPVHADVAHDELRAGHEHRRRRS